MARIAYVNGRYLPLDTPAIRVEDRGFQFADGVYEVWSVREGRFLDHAGHMARLERSLAELSIPMPMTRRALDVVLRETLRRNRIRDGLVYLQVTRGAAARNHPFPTPAPRPTLVVTARPADLAGAERKAAEGVGVISTPDNRWGRCDIKSVGLLPNVLAKQAAREAGAHEAWFVDAEGRVTEGASSTAWIVTADGVLTTRHLDRRILPGITRTTVRQALETAGIPFEERAFTLDEARAAKEAFITSASSFVTPVVRLDGAPIGEGAPGPVARRLRGLYEAAARGDGAA